MKTEWTLNKRYYLHDEFLGELTGIVGSNSDENVAVEVSVYFGSTDAEIPEITEGDYFELTPVFVNVAGHQGKIRLSREM